MSLWVPDTFNDHFSLFLPPQVDECPINHEKKNCQMDGMDDLNSGQLQMWCLVWLLQTRQRQSGVGWLAG